ncbi:MAG: hypothetical protein KBF88_09985, partial [Polyangiaceae bacterium]|nr:hypothetical protein [Polyangiaceae bacterium]
RLNPPRDAGLLENTWRLQSALEWMTPVDVVNDALETNRAQFSGVREPATVPISSMAGPKLETYPWAKLTQALAVSSPMMEPLAAFVPADFYFIRFATLPKLVEAFDVFEKRFATPLYGNAMLFGHDVAAAERDLSSRYHTELGLRTGPLTKALGGVVVSEVAIVGSDPYIVEGTDLSLVFRVKNKPAFELALQESLRSFVEKHGAIETEAGPESSTLSKSKDGQVHTTRGWIKGDVYVVSNSANAFSKIAGAANGKAKSLGAEPDLQYILARDTATKTANTEMFAFMGEEFVRSVTGPKQKLAELRRAIALMELRAPGYAELLFRRYTGRAPKNVQELRDAKMLRKEDLEHRDGSSIHYELGEAATSKWGSLARPKALLDLPEVTMLTKSEAEAYKHFSATYNDSYARYIDPISMRAKIAMDTEKPFLEYDVRVLPPSKDRLGNDERKWIREFGLGRIEAPRQDEGLHLAVGIGKGSHLRRELEEFGSNVPFVGKVQLEWIGDVASFGLFETNTLPNLYARMNREGGRGTMNMISQLTKLPLYVSLEVSSPLALGVLLSRVKKEVVGNGGEGIEWDAAFTHHDATVTRIGEKKGTGASSQGNELQAFYVVHKKQLVVTFREDVMRRAIDMIDAGTFAKRADETALGAGSANLSMQASLAPAGAFIKALQRSVSAAAMRESYRTRPSEELAEIIFLAYPEAQKNTAMFEEISTRLLGGVPSAGTRGSRYTYGAEGIVDPVLGSRIDERRLREDPDGATGLLDLLSTLARFDAKISFDPEAVSSEVKAQETLRSLHFQGRVELRK